MPPPNSFIRAFRSLSDRWLEESQQLFPQEASEMGFREFDGMLGANDAQTHLTYRKLLRETLQGVEALPDGAFTGDDWLDRRGFLALLRTSLLFNEREHWRINPQQHCDAAVNAIFNLLVRYADRLEEGSPAIESRLALLPGFLAQGASCVRRPVPLWVKLAVKSCDGAVAFLKEAGEQIIRVSEDPAHARSLLEGAITAFDAYARSIEAKPSGEANGYALGKEAFEYLARERTGLSLSVGEIQAIGQTQATELAAALAKESRKFGRKTAEQIIEQARDRWKPTAGTLLEEYQRVNARVRQDFESSGIVGFPKNERCKVMLVPPFLRHHFPTAAYSQPGAFDKDQTGIFWVNDLSLFTTDPRKKEAEIKQHFGLDFTCAHEAYPGHHLQFCIQNQHPSRLRRLFHHAIFYEGWTLWCEKMAVDQGIIDFPEARLIQLHDALWRAHRIGIDCGLHAGGLSFAGACRRLQEGVGFTAARAKGDVNWYTSSPTVPMSYLLGRLELERMHARLVGEEGWTLRQFNDWILSFGAIPWGWIWQSRLHGAAGAGV